MILSCPNIYFIVIKLCLIWHLPVLIIHTNRCTYVNWVQLRSAYELHGTINLAKGRIEKTFTTTDRILVAGSKLSLTTHYKMLLMRFQSSQLFTLLNSMLAITYRDIQFMTCKNMYITIIIEYYVQLYIGKM